MNTHIFNTDKCTNIPHVVPPPLPPDIHDCHQHFFKRPALGAAERASCLKRPPGIVGEGSFYAGIVEWDQFFLGGCWMKQAAHVNGHLW